MCRLVWVFAVHMKRGPYNKNRLKLNIHVGSIFLWSLNVFYLITIYIWASMQENLTDAWEQQKHRPVCASTQSDLCLCFCFLDSIMMTLSTRKISTFWLVSVAEQTGLNLTWLQTRNTGFLVSLPIYTLPFHLSLVSNSHVMHTVSTLRRWLLSYQNLNCLQFKKVTLQQNNPSKCLF